MTVSAEEATGKQRWEAGKTPTNDPDFFLHESSPTLRHALRRVMVPDREFVGARVSLRKSDRGTGFMQGASAEGVIPLSILLGRWLA